MRQGIPITSNWIRRFGDSDSFENKKDPQNTTISHIRNRIKKKLEKFKELTPYIDTIFPRGTAINKCPNIQISVDMKKLKKLLNCDKICGV